MRAFAFNTHGRSCSRCRRNLFLLGTMNTADRSIALVDSALRRRFLFQELSGTKPPVDTVLEKWLAAHDHDPDAAVLLRELNAAIDDDDFSIGPSYFITRDGALPNIKRSGRTRSCRSCGSATTAPTRTLNTSGSPRSAGASKLMRIDLTAWSEQFEDLPAEVATGLTQSGLVDVRLAGPPAHWRLVTDSCVGVSNLPNCEVRVAPKLAIPRLMFLLGYATTRVDGGGSRFPVRC